MKHIRPITVADNPQMEMIIKTTMTEFGAFGPGFSINDPEVSFISEAYNKKLHAYFVIAEGDRIFGGAGIAPLSGEENTCELRKMYFLSEIRGLGFGQKLMDRCLEQAREFGFKRCYLETLKTMKSAEQLYIKNGFKALTKPLGNTGHFSCDSYFILEL